MQATVVLIYDDSSKNREITVQCRGKGQRLMNSIDRAVSKAASDDKYWTRWNLLELHDDPPELHDDP